ncbi:MAG: hypothetical protein V3S55_14590, partial [Nitrospiraceae bacterium]
MLPDLEAYRRKRRQMPGLVDRALSIAVLPGDSPEEVRTKRLLAGVLWVSLPITVLSSVQLALVFDAPVAGLTVSSVFLSVMASL